MELDQLEVLVVMEQEFQQLLDQMDNHQDHLDIMLVEVVVEDMDQVVMEVVVEQEVLVVDQVLVEAQVVDQIVEVELLIPEVAVEVLMVGNLILIMVQQVVQV
jgi:hypothetical protein